MIRLIEGSTGKPKENISTKRKELPVKKDCCAECRYFKAYFVMWYCTLQKKSFSPHFWCCNFKKKGGCI